MGSTSTPMEGRDLPEVYHRLEQPGLEVIPHNPGLEVANKEGPTPAYSSGSTVHKPYGTSGYRHVETPASPRRTRRRWYLIGAAVAVLVIIGAVVGAVVGQKASSGGSGASSSSSGAPNSGPGSGSGSGPRPVSIRQASSLGVTGWRSGSVFFIWLFYQGPDSQIRLQRFDSSAGKWTDPTLIVKARKDSPIGVGSFQYGNFFGGGGTFNQIELLYANDTDWVQEWNFNDTNPIGNPGSIQEPKYQFGAGITRMSMYWPNSIQQDSLGRLYELFYTVGVGWAFQHLFITANYTGVAMLPNILEPRLDHFSMVFQQSDGNMINSIGNQTIGYSGNTLKTPIPLSAAIGAFTVPHESSKNDLDTYVLSQASSGDFEMRWQVDGGDWQGPQGFPALKGADKDTNIACLTPNAWPATNMLPQHDMSRCYFQVDGWLKEVHYDGKDWEDLGKIPMP